MSDPELQIGKVVEASTGTPTGKVGAQPATLYYDENCGLCRQLAHLISRSAERNGLEVLPSQESAPDELVIATQSERYAGRDAWTWLVTHHSVFREWNWLATKLGLQDESTTLVMRGADMLRRFCSRCRKPTQF